MPLNDYAHLTTTNLPHALRHRFEKGRYQGSQSRVADELLSIYRIYRFGQSHLVVVQISMQLTYRAHHVIFLRHPKNDHIHALLAKKRFDHP